MSLAADFRTLAIEVGARRTFLERFEGDLRDAFSPVALGKDLPLGRGSISHLEVDESDDGASSRPQSEMGDIDRLSVASSSSSPPNIALPEIEQENAAYPHVYQHDSTAQMLFDNLPYIEQQPALVRMISPARAIA